MIIGCIFKEIGDEADDWGAALILSMFFLSLVGVGVYHTYLSFGWIYSSVVLFLLTEIVYHLEPRSSYDKHNGRGYGKVFAKKIDSLLDAMLVVALSTGVYKLVKLFNLASVIDVLQKIGWVILIILGIVGLIFGYLWLNRLRDRPPKAKESSKARPPFSAKKEMKK